MMNKTNVEVHLDNITLYPVRTDVANGNFVLGYGIKDSDDPDLCFSGNILFYDSSADIQYFHSQNSVEFNPNIIHGMVMKCRLGAGCRCSSPNYGRKTFKMITKKLMDKLPYLSWVKYEEV